jgi:hypothetical protein
MQVVAIHPNVAAIDSDAQFDAFRRDWLNIFQLSPKYRTLANNAPGTTCGFCFYEYADVAAQTPPLATRLTALDMIRQTLDTIIAGSKAYGMPGYGAYHDFSADTARPPARHLRQASCSLPH